MVQGQYVRLALGEKVRNAFTMKYLNVVDPIDVLVSDRINLEERTLLPLVLLVLRLQEPLLLRLRLGMGLGLDPHTLQLRRRLGTCL